VEVWRVPFAWTCINVSKIARLDQVVANASEWLYFFPWRQGQHREKGHANPGQDAEARSEEAGAHVPRLSELDGFGKFGPRVLAPQL
jgi:hypothetical protein